MPKASARDRQSQQCGVRPGFQNGLAHPLAKAVAFCTIKAFLPGKSGTKSDVFSLHPVIQSRAFARVILWTCLVCPFTGWSQSIQNHGTITFPAESAHFLNSITRLEKSVGNEPKIIINPSVEPSVDWEFKPSRWGSYWVEALVDTKSPGAIGQELEVTIGGHTLRSKIAAEPITARSHPGALGRLYLDHDTPTRVTLRLVGTNDSASITLMSLALHPAPEGPIPPLNAEGVITLPAGSATTHSDTMRYEPATNKNCLGYWVNPSDTASWQFDVPKAGSYDVELWQGCGRGQGGSTVRVEVGGQSLGFTVEETGHFQNFVPRRLGRVSFAKAGDFTLAIQPQKKAGVAVMDVRQVRLIPTAMAQEPAPGARAFVSAKRVVILGDSITYDGKWVDFLETWLRLTYPDSTAEILNLGLPSETASGLSEAGHAGGAFPRPALNERLDRVLQKTHPDLILACYGMNDGIYFPFSEDRLKSFQEGIQRLHEKAAHEGIRVIHLTPPIFDPVPLGGRTLPAGRDTYPQPYEAYNQVLDQYSSWLVGQRSQGWQVIDVHAAMNHFVAERRARDDKFTVSPDGVHPNEQGHWLITREVLKEFGAPAAEISDPEATALLASFSPVGKKDRAQVLALVRKRQVLLKDAWLTSVGHQRPGMNSGKPLPDAQKEAESLTGELNGLLRR